MDEKLYIVLAALAIVVLVAGCSKEYFTDRRQIKYMRPVNPRSPGFEFDA